MKLHEYQAKDLLRKRGVFTLESHVCFTLEEAKQAIRDIGLPCVIKAQVHAGGRGKAGGIKVANNEADAIRYTESILAMNIKTAQTMGAGQKVSCVLVERATSIEREIYLSMLVDRETASICLMASDQGGVEIEEVAARDPGAIKKVHIKRAVGLMPYQVRALASDLLIKGSLQRKFVSLVLAVYRTFMDCDASLIEINPLVNHLVIGGNDQRIDLYQRGVAIHKSSIDSQDQ